MKTVRIATAQTPEFRGFGAPRAYKRFSRNTLVGLSA